MMGLVGVVFVSQESEGEGSSVDVSRELRRVLELEGSEEEESEKEEEGGRIVDILHHPSNAEQGTGETHTSRLAVTD